MFTLLTRRQLSAPATRPAAHPAPATDEDAGLRPCGWFDSSHELHEGLRVTEHASPDAVAAELPLGDWLGLHLQGWQPHQALGGHAVQVVAGVGHLAA